MKKFFKKYFLFVLFFLIFLSCSRQKTIDEMLVSDNILDKRYAIDEIWRLNKTEYSINLINFLFNNDLKIKSAFALSFLNNLNNDKIILQKLKNENPKDGALFYFYLTFKKRKLDDDILNYLKNNLNFFSDKETFIIFMIFALNNDKDNISDRLIKQYEIVKNILELEIKREFILLAGEKKFKKVYEILKKEEIAELKPFIKWSMHRIEKPDNIIPDKKDRVILKNIYWTKYEKNPVIPIVPNTFKSVHTANPDLLLHNDMIYFYYRGGDGNDRIAVATVPYEYFDGVRFIDYAKNPIIDIGKKSFDDLAVLDPAAIFFNNKIFLYYSGLGTVKPDSIGLAVSKDFFNFSKVKKNPVLTGRAPEIVLKDGLLYLYYVLVNNKLGYSIYLATSRDGYNFTEYKKSPVFEYSSFEDDWDAKTVTTPRIIKKGDVYYMVYAGDNKYLDYPPYFGIAFSYDLINWYRSTQNPIFSRGKKGEWDDGGIWFAQIFEYKNKWYMWYEGWGGGESHENEYGRGGHSQIGLAICDKYDIDDML